MSDSFCHIGDGSGISTKRIVGIQWQKLYAFLQGHPRAYAGQEEKCRGFLRQFTGYCAPAPSGVNYRTQLWQVEQFTQGLRTPGRERWFLLDNPGP